MADTIITVQGEHSAWYPAERATVRATIIVDGPKRDAVFAGAVSASDAVRASIEALFDKTAGPVTWWTSDSVRVWSDRPWNSDGKRLPLVFHSAIDVSAKFLDFDELSRWVEATAAIEFVTISSISWDLTEATRTSVTAEVRSRAVKDAVAKATVYAQAIGLGSVTAVALADQGMLGDPSVNASGSGTAMPYRSALKMQAFDAAQGPTLALKPEEIVVESFVDGRFVAS